MPGTPRNSETTKPERPAGHGVTHSPCSLGAGAGDLPPKAHAEELDADRTEHRTHGSKGDESMTNCEANRIWGQVYDAWDAFKSDNFERARLLAYHAELDVRELDLDLHSDLVDEIAELLEAVFEDDVDYEEYRECMEAEDPDADGGEAPDEDVAGT